MDPDRRRLLLEQLADPNTSLEGLFGFNSVQALEAVGLSLLDERREQEARTILELIREIAPGRASALAERLSARDSE